MQNTNKASFIALIALLFLLPIFFIPAAAVPLGLSKAILMVVAIVAAFAVLLVDSFRGDGMTLPSHWILWAALALPAVYIASALLSAAPELSLFGYALESGTAASLTLLGALFGMTAIVFRDRERLLKAYGALFLSLALLSIFALVKLFSGGELFAPQSLSGVMGNPVGAWTDYAIVFGLLAVLSTFALEMLPLRKAIKAALWIVFAISLVVLSAANFKLAWMLALAAAVVLLVYFITVERGAASGERRSRPGIIAAGILGAIALFFIWNPVVSPTAGGVGNAAAQFFGVRNAEVRPSFRSTLDVTRDVIGENPVLGAGPNTFGKSWLLHKPAEVNSSAFWSSVFPFGFGFVPTQASAVGLLGSAVWTLFFISFVALGVRAFGRSPAERADRFLVLGSFLGALLLWIAAFFYPPSATVLALAFIFTGLFVAATAVTGVVGERTLSFSRNVVTHFAAVLVLIALAVGTAAFALVSYQKISAVARFQHALALASAGSPSERVEAELAKAANLSPADVFWRALSELELAKANAALNATGGTQAENAQAFQTALSRSIAYAQNAIDLNPTYSNWVALGNIYASLVPEPLAVDGAYDSAKSAYESASRQNPSTPELPLLLARLESANGNTTSARSYIDQALEIKPDYAEAYFLLAQLDIRANNLPQAIRSAETGVLLSPGNAGVLFQLGLLKYGNNDFAGAAQAFERALEIVPDYANARFYLGLALDTLGRKDEAIAEFEALAETNPDNQTVTAVLENLHAGRSALAGLGNAGSATAPISGQ